MKYFKYILVIILSVFTIKTVENNFNIGLNKNITNEYTFTTEVKNINVELNNANVDLYYADISEIKVITNQSVLNEQSVSITVGHDTTTNTINVVSYHKENTFNFFNNYPTVSIIMPTNKIADNVNLAIENGIIKDMVSSNNLTISSESANIKTSGSYNKLSITQTSGRNEISNSNVEDFELNCKNTNIYFDNLTSVNTIIDSSQSQLDVNKSFFKTLELKGDYKDVDFYNIIPANIEVEAKEIKTTNLNYNDQKYSYSVPEKEKGSMKISAPNITINKFILQKE